MATRNDRAVVELVLNGEQAKTSLKAVSVEVTKARSALLRMQEADDPALYRAKVQEYHKLIAAQRQMRGAIDDTTTAWGRFKKEAAQVMTGVLGGNIATAGLQALANLIPSTIDKTMKLSDSFADMAKATGLSTEKVKDLNKQIKDIDTRTANKDLRDIAVAGGQLGVANDQMVSFVKNADMAVVALGDEFSGGVEEVAKGLGGVAKLFKETKEMDIGEAISRIGSGMNELGAAGSATAPVITEFVTRMGQLGGLAPSLAETAGYGAALQELGMTAEIAASGLGKILMVGANQSELFAQHLGKTKEYVEALINSNPDGFLKELAASFQGLTQTQVVQRMKELKLESDEAIKVMSLLANQTEFVEKKQKLYGDAFAKNTSLADEFAKKNFQLARDLKSLNEWFNSLFTSESVTGFITSATHNAAEFVKVLPQVGGWLEKNATYLWLIAAAAFGYWKTNTGLTASIISQTIAKQVSYQLDMLTLRWLYLKDAATKAYALTTGVLTGQISIQTAAVTIGTRVWAGFTAVLAANPIGLVIAGLAGLVAGIKYFSEHSERALKVEREKNSIQKQVQLVTEQHARAQKELNEKLGTYNNLSVTERANLEKTIALKAVEARARLSALQVRAKENALQAREISYWQQVQIKFKNSVGMGTGYRNDVFKQQRENFDSTYKDSLGDTSGLEAELKGYEDMQKQIERLKNPAKTGGKTLNTITDPEEEKRKKKSAADKLAADAKREAEELERQLGEARKTALRQEETDYEKSITAFAAKYAKMYELAGANADKIKEIETISMVEWGAIMKEQNERDLKEQFDKGQKELEILRDTAKAKIDLQLASGLITDQEANTKRLAVDQTYLSDQQRTTTAYFAQLEQLYASSAGKLKKIEADKKLALTALDKSAQEQDARSAENSKKIAEKALSDDLAVLERNRSQSRLKIQQDLQAGRINDVQAKNAELDVERKFLADKHRLYESYYDLLLKMGVLSADQIKAVERDKAKALGEIDEQMLGAQQKQYEGKLGGWLKIMDEYEQNMQNASTILQSLFQVDQNKLGVGDQLTELDKLQNKTNLTAAEQERMQKIIAKIGETMPGVVTGTNSYGEAISINTDAARKEVDAQRARAKVMQRVMQAEKAWALARVSILYGQTLMQAIAAGASIPFPGNLVAIAKSMAIPTLQYGASIARITSSGTSVPAFADGGFTGSGDGPAGYVDRATLFEMGRRRYVAGEAGREFVISNRALQNPVVANFAGMMDVAQRTNNYSMLGAGMGAGATSAPAAAPGGQPVSNGPQLGVLLAGFERLEEAIREQGAKPVVNNFHAWEEYYNNVQTIRNENTIKHSQAA